MTLSSLLTTLKIYWYLFCSLPFALVIFVQGRLAQRFSVAEMGGEEAGKDFRWLEPASKIHGETAWESGLVHLGSLFM